MIIEPSIKANFQYKNEIKTLESNSNIEEIVSFKENNVLKEENEKNKKIIEELEEENKELKAELKLMQKQLKKGGE